MNRRFDFAEPLEAKGFAHLPAFITPKECREIEALWNHRQLFRSEVEMRRHGYGEGTYRYFANPLPEPIAGLRRTAYPEGDVVPARNRWRFLRGRIHPHGGTLTYAVQRLGHHSRARRRHPLSESVPTGRDSARILASHDQAWSQRGSKRYSIDVRSDLS
jgi:hypothetical protein